MDVDARIEDLEEALRRIVVVISPDGHHVTCERDEAVLALALDALDLY
jgi:hypothetical protein